MVTSFLNGIPHVIAKLKLNNFLQFCDVKSLMNHICDVFMEDKFSSRPHWL